MHPLLPLIPSIDQPARPRPRSGRRRPRSLLCLVLTAAALCVRFSDALAQNASTLVIESWVGGPSPQERTWAASLRQLLGTRSGAVTASAEVAAALGSRRPLSPQSDASASKSLADQLTSARAALNEAMGQYRQGRFLAAEKELATLVDMVLQHPLLFATEVGRPILRQSLVYLMLSRSRLRQATASTVAEELVRTFPDEGDRVFVEFGPLADKLYRSAEAKLVAAGRGTLVVEVDDRDAVVSVNEGLGTSRVFEKSVLPGTYRVLVKTASKGARRYVVNVLANETARLSIQWRLHVALSLAGEAVAFVFDSDRERSGEGLLAAELARTANLGTRAALVGTRFYDGARALSVSLFDSASGQHVATALAPMDGKDVDAKLLALRDFIASGGAARDRRIVTSTRPLETVAELSPQRAARRATARAGWPAYAATTASVATFATAIWLLERDAPCARLPCAEPPRLASYALFGTSVALAAYATYHWLAPSSARTVAPTIAIGGDTVSISVLGRM